jgi:hypothetical protein
MRTINICTDPDPSINKQKKFRKPWFLTFKVLRLLNGLKSLKTNVNVPRVSYKQKNLFLMTFLKANEEKSNIPIRSRIRNPVIQTRIRIRHETSRIRKENYLRPILMNVYCNALT